MSLKTSAFNSVTHRDFIEKQFLESFKILMLHAVLDSILSISSLKFDLFSNIMRRHLTDADSPMRTPLTLRYDGLVFFFLMKQTRYILSSYCSSLFDVIGNNNTIFQYFFPINFWLYFQYYEKNRGKCHRCTGLLDNCHYQ